MAASSLRLLPLVSLLPLLLSPCALAVNVTVTTCIKRSITPALSSLEAPITSVYVFEFYYVQWLSQINGLSFLQLAQSFSGDALVRPGGAKRKSTTSTITTAVPLFAFVTPGALSPGGTFNSISTYTVPVGAGAANLNVTYVTNYSVTITLPQFEVTFAEDIVAETTVVVGAAPKPGASSSSTGAAASASTGASGTATSAKAGRKLVGSSEVRRKLQSTGGNIPIVGDIIVSGFQLSFTAPALPVNSNGDGLPLTPQALSLYNFSLRPTTAILKASFTGFFGTGADQVTISASGTVNLDLFGEGSFVQLLCAQKKTALQCKTAIDFNPFYIFFLLGYNVNVTSSALEGNVAFLGTVSSVVLSSAIQTGTDFKKGTC